MTDYTKIDELKRELEDLLPMDEEQQRKLDDKLRLEINYNSNHMEGNTLTYGETRLALFFDQTTSQHTIREYQEMKAHDAAYRYIQESAADPERFLSERFIKKLNEIILVEPFYKEAITPEGQNVQRLITIGAYKIHPNNVRLPNGEIFQFASPEETPGKMHDLIQCFRNNENELHPLELATLFHYKLVRIHPFDDGNGRVARLIMNYILLKHSFPPVVIRSADRQNYYRVLREADVGNFIPLLSFIKDQLVWSLNLSIQAAKGMDISEDEDLDKQIDLFVRDQKAKHDSKISKTPERIYTVYKNGIEMLFKKLVQQMMKFEKLYEDIRVIYGVAHYSDKRDDPDWLNKVLAERKNKNQITDQIWVLIALRKYHNNSDRYYNIKRNVYVDFSADSYLVISGNDTLIEKGYNEYLLEEEINYVINKEGEDTMNEIKKKGFK